MIGCSRPLRRTFLLISGRIAPSPRCQTACNSSLVPKLWLPTLSSPPVCLIKRPTQRKAQPPMHLTRNLPIKKVSPAMPKPVSKPSRQRQQYGQSTISSAPMSCYCHPYITSILLLTYTQHLVDLLRYRTPRSRHPRHEPLCNQRLSPPFPHCYHRNHVLHHRRAVQDPLGQTIGYVGATTRTFALALRVGGGIHHDGFV